jgi:tripartite-type tricarboxylate transporter receptor subunit TctC
MAVMPARAEYPDKPIKLVVPFVPGGGTDAIARLTAQKLELAFGQGVVVENVGGAGGTIAAEGVARAAPDGYTLLVGTESTHGTNSVRPIRYDPIKDFAPVTLLATSPTLFVANPAVPASNTAELIAYAKANPGKLNFGSWGNASSTHLALEQFKAMSGTDITHVPYKGGGPAMTAVITKEVDLAFQGLNATLPFVKDGRAKVIGVGGPKRVKLLPDVPTIAESGLPGFQMYTWFAVFAPAGTPPAVVDRLQREIAKVLALPDVQERLQGLGMEIVASSPDQLKAVVASEVDKWQKLVRERKLTFE